MGLTGVLSHTISSAGKIAEQIQVAWTSRSVEVITGTILAIAGALLVPALGPVASIMTLAALAFFSSNYLQGPASSELVERNLITLPIAHTTIYNSNQTPLLDPEILSLPFQESGKCDPLSETRESQALCKPQEPRPLLIWGPASIFALAVAILYATSNRWRGNTIHPSANALQLWDRNKLDSHSLFSSSICPMPPYPVNFSLDFMNLYTEGDSTIETYKKINQDVSQAKLSSGQLDLPSLTMQEDLESLGCPTPESVFEFQATPPSPEKQPTSSVNHPSKRRMRRPIPSPTTEDKRKLKADLKALRQNVEAYNERYRTVEP